MLLAIPATVFLVGQQLQTSIKAEKSTTLSFNPVTKTASAGDKVDFDIFVSPGTNLVNYIKLVIKYDPSIFSADEASFVIDPDSGLKLIQGPTVASGNVTIALSTTNPTDYLNKEAKLGNISFGVIATSSSEAQLSFASNLVQIRSLGSNDGVLENVFLNGTPATVSILTSESASNVPTSDSASAPMLLNPTSNEKVSDQTPSFEGTAQPNETVNITINSPQTITAQVKADSTGNWSYIPTTNLTPGNHTITISSRDSNGVLRTITQTFSVLAAQAEASGNTLGPTCTSLIADVTTTGEAPYTLGFTAGGSDTSGTIDKVSFNFGDGGSLDLTQGGGIGTSTVSTTASHTYLNPGSFNATAILTNDQGSISDTASCTLAVTITGSGSGALSPIPATGPSPAVIGVGVLGGVLLLIGVLLFFVL